MAAHLCPGALLLQGESRDGVLVSHSARHSFDQILFGRGKNHIDIPEKAQLFEPTSKSAIAALVRDDEPPVGL